jgi:hypothetical protein
MTASSTPPSPNPGNDHQTKTPPVNVSLTVVERARRYQARCRASISGQEGHNAAFQVAVTLVHGFALGETDALSLMREFNRRCVPPWREGELIHKIKSAANTVHPRPRSFAGRRDEKWPAGSKPAAPAAAAETKVPTRRAETHREQYRGRQGRGSLPR